MNQMPIPTDPLSLSALAGFIVIFFFWHYRKKVMSKLRGEKKPSQILPSVEGQEAASELTQKKNEQEVVIDKPAKLRCICFRKVQGVNVVDFTTIPNPIGELYQFDPSCPSTGSGYIVYEAYEDIPDLNIKKGDILDYDPRQVAYNLHESPEVAYFAIDWSILKDVLYVPVKWWKDASMLFAGIMLAIVFVLGLVVLGG